MSDPQVIPVKKVRGSNYTNNEKSDLCNIIAEFKHIIECKKSDSMTWKAKEVTWEEIATQFNALNPNVTYRYTESLKKCYENIKHTTKKQVADEKIEIIKTGGGRVKNIRNPVYDKALSIMNTKIVHGLPNSFDSEGIAISKNDGDDFMVEIISDTTEEEYSSIIKSITQKQNEQVIPRVDSILGIIDKDSFVTNANENWRHYAPTDLKKPLNKKLKIRTTEILSPSKYIVSPIQSEVTSGISANKQSESSITDASKKITKNSTSSKHSQWRLGIIGLNSTDLAKEYSDLAKIKILIAKEQLQLLQTEIESSRIKKDREKEENDLRKQSLELDIAIKNYKRSD